MPVPIHAIRRQAELCPGLLRDLEAGVANGLPLDQQLAQHYRRHREFGSRDRRFFSNLAFAWFRWRGWLADPASPGIPDCVLAWLLDAPEMHPALDLLAETLPPPPVPWRALGNAALADKARILGQWRQSSPPELAALAPAWFADALFYPDGTDRGEHLQRCLQAFQLRPPTWLRTATGQAQKTIQLLSRQHIATGAHPVIHQALRLPDGCNREILNSLPEVELQDLASQCVGLICAPADAEAWWDACAGSGGKSFHLADLMNGSGSILATDIRTASIGEGRRRLHRNHIKTISLRAWDGTAATAPDRLFDGVLLDAPCSGIGTWHRNPDARWRTSPDSVPRHAELQSALLNICAGKVRPGGRLVYAVCTLSAAETTGVIESFLAARPDFRLAPAPHPLTGEATSGHIWIWPWQGECNGMFIARLTKS